MQMTMQTLPVPPSVGEQIPAAGKGPGRKPAADTFASLLGIRMETAPAAGAFGEGENSFAQTAALPAEGSQEAFGAMPKLASGTPATGEEPILENPLPLWVDPAGSPTQIELPLEAGTELSAPVVAKTVSEPEHPVADSVEALVPTEPSIGSAETPLPAILSTAASTAASVVPPVQTALAPPVPSATVVSAETVQPLSASLPAPATEKVPAAPSEKRPGLLERQFAALVEGVREAPVRSGAFREVSENRPLPIPQASSPASAVLAAATSSEGAAVESPTPVFAETESVTPSVLPAAHPLAAGDTPAPVQLRAAPADAPAVALPSGQSVPESRIIDQVVGRLAIAPGGEGGSVTLKLHPEELGEVTVDLVLEKDRVKAQIIAQSQQVQEVLEKHLPKLRGALENQGLKLDALQVSVDSQGDGGRGFFQQHQRPSSPVRFALHGQPAPGREPMQAVQTAPREGRGISLRI